MKSLVWRIVLCAVALVFLALIGTYIYISSFLKSEEFRVLLEQEAGYRVHGKVSLSPLERDGKYLRVNQASAEIPNSLVQQASASNVDIDINYRKLLDRTLHLNSVRVQKVNLALNNLPLAASDGSDAVDAEIVEEVEETGLDSYLPNKFEFGELSIRDFNLDSATPWGNAELRNIQLDITHSGQSYKINLTNGSFLIPWEMFPKGELEHATLRYTNNQIIISDLKAKVGTKGRLALDGGWSLAPNESNDLNIALQGVGLHEILPPDWIKSVDGELSGYCKISRTAKNEFIYRGDVNINRGVLTALPVLDTLAAFTFTSRFRRIDWNTAQANYRYENNIWYIDNILLASDGLVRIEGSITIDGDKIAGTLMLGLPAGLLSHIPGAEEVVFRPENYNNKLGLLWAPVRLSGTLSSIKEDLSSRLMNAAGERLFKIIPGGEKVLNFSKSAADTLLNQMTPKDDKNDKDKKEDSIKSGIKMGEDLLKSGLDAGLELLP